MGHEILGGAEVGVVGQLGGDGGELAVRVQARRAGEDADEPLREPGVGTDDPVHVQPGSGGLLGRRVGGGGHDASAFSFSASCSWSSSGVSASLAPSTAPPTLPLAPCSWVPPITSVMSLPPFCSRSRQNGRARV